MYTSCSVILFYQFSVVVVDVASIVLGFDMRRLNDVTAFRKCWYRKSVMESFMLGSHQKKATTSSTSKPNPKHKTTSIPEESTGILVNLLNAKMSPVAFYSWRYPTRAARTYSCRDCVCSKYL